MKSLFFEHVDDLTGPKYAEKYEDSEFDIKTIHFLANAIHKHDFSIKHFSFFDPCFWRMLGGSDFAPPAVLVHS